MKRVCDRVFGPIKGRWMVGRIRRRQFPTEICRPCRGLYGRYFSTSHASSHERENYDDIDAGTVQTLSKSTPFPTFQRFLEDSLDAYSECFLPVPQRADALFRGKDLSVLSDSAATRIAHIAGELCPNTKRSATVLRFEESRVRVVDREDATSAPLDGCGELLSDLSDAPPSSRTIVFTFDRDHLQSSSSTAVLNAAYDAMREAKRNGKRVVVVGSEADLRCNSRWSQWEALAKLRRDDEKTTEALFDLPPWFWLPQLSVVTGPMFAGKTSRLLEFLEFATSGGSLFHDKRSIVIKPDVDTRSPQDTLRSHDGVTYPTTGSTSSLRPSRAGPGKSIDALRIRLSNSPDLVVDNGAFVGLDEAHFFDDSVVDFCKRVTREQPMSAIVAVGLDLDYQKLPFGHLHNLDARVTGARVEKLLSKCSVCGEPAAFTTRTKPSKAKVLVGAEEVYSPACEAHHAVVL